MTAQASALFGRSCPEPESAHDCLCIERIRRWLDTETIGFEIHLFWEVDSTHAVLGRLAAGARTGAVVIAEAQRDGRDRRGEPWFSPAAANLYVSVLLRPRIRPSEVPVFSFITSLALGDVLRAEGVASAIKWPNDILVGGRKVAGAVLLYTIVGDRVREVILGAAVNLNVERVALQAALGEAAGGATSVREAAGRPVDRNAFAAAFLNALERWAEVYRTRGPDDVLRAWRTHEALAGRWVEIRDQDETYRGRALGVNRDGRLVVEDVTGAAREVLTGEVVILD